MKRLSIFFAALVVSMMTFATDYEKVTSAPTDWTGEYILVYESSTTEAYVWTGVDEANCYATATIADNKVSGDNFVTIKIATMDAGYSIIVNGGTNNGKYIYGAAKSNKLNFGTTASLNTLSYESGSVKITSNTAVMRFNSNSDQMRFRYFQSTSYTRQQVVQLYKKVAGPAKNAESVALDQNTLELEQYKYVTLKATPNPTDATDEWEWASDNEAVAKVDANGKVTVVAATGTANIKVTSKTTASVFATCTVTAKAATPITVAEAVEIGQALGNGGVAAGGMYVIRGFVTALTGKTPAEQFNTYGNYSVYIDDTKGGKPAFEAYQVVPTDGKSIAEVGDSVEVIGDITKYNSTIETVEKTGTIRILKKATYTVTPLSNDADMGNVRGGGTFDRKDSATVYATAYTGFEFVAWVAENKTDTLSKEATYKFEVTKDAKVYAIFKAEQPLTPATWYGQAPLTGTLTGTNPEVNYSIVYEITRTELRYLTVKCEINDEAAALTGFGLAVILDGSSYCKLTKDDSGIYSCTTTKKYTDGEIVNMKFYMTYMGGETYADEISYTVGSSNNKPTAIETVSNNDTKATKRIVNGVLVIEKNGVRYNAQGVVME